MIDATVNVEQAKAWDGDEGEHWATHHHRYDDGVRLFHARLLDAAGIGSGDRVLDVGCGCGQSTRDAARRAPSGSALGVDLSAAMLAQARRAAERDGVTNATFLQADAQVHSFDPGAFDVAMSRFGAMFFGDAVAAFANIARAMVPGGRLVMLSWRGLDQNEWLREIRGALAAGRTLPVPPPDAPSPFGLADPDRVRHVLAAGGFDDVELEAVDAPIYFGGTVDEAVTFLSGTGVAQGLLGDLDDAARSSALADLQRRVEAHAGDDGVGFGASSWLITARRRR